MSADSTAIFVLGMHRSGTSCLAGSLQQKGVFLGEANTENRFNPKGNRENQEATNLNESILVASGGSWYNPPTTLQFTQEHIDERDRLLRKFYESNANYWGIKDPRMLFTLPFWKDSISRLTLVGSYRHPLSVAKSLNSRSKIPIEQGLKLWAAYNWQLIDCLKQFEIPLISFDECGQDYLESLSVLFERLGLEGGNKEGMDDFYSKSLQHHETDDGSVILDDQIMDVYDALSAYKERFWSTPSL